MADRACSWFSGDTPAQQAASTMMGVSGRKALRSMYLVLITEDGCEVLNDYTKELIVVPEE